MNPSEVPNIKPVPNLPQYKWNEQAKQYIDSKGRFVSRNTIRTELSKVFDTLSRSAANLSDSLLAGDISLAKWQLEMMRLTKQSHLVGAAMDAGGWFQMTSSDFGRVGNVIKASYADLNSWALDIASGKQPFNGNIRRISRLFGQRGRKTYYEGSRVKAIQDGFDLIASKTTPADHCFECVSEEARGFISIGDPRPLKAIGDRICRSNCRCYLVFKNSSTGEERST